MHAAKLFEEHMIEATSRSHPASLTTTTTRTIGAAVSSISSSRTAPQLFFNNCWLPSSAQQAGAGAGAGAEAAYTDRLLQKQRHAR
jgi:hypothetical protein